MVLDVERTLHLLQKQAHVNDMLQLLLSTVPADLDRIDQCLQRADREGAYRVLHQLKGFLPMFCTEAFSHDLVMVTRLCKADDAAPFHAAFGPVRAALDQVCVQARAYLDSHA